jgi:hypothetical protein
LKRVRMTWIVGACVASFVAFVACTQGEGETCQVNSDCDKALMCCRAVGDAPRGSCHVGGSPECRNAAVTDAGGAHDAGHDAGMSVPPEDGG